MYPLIKSKKVTHLFIVLFGFACFALVPVAQAVSPPPDGGYPGGNTAEGQTALLSLTSGGFNTAVGLFSLRALTDGNFNTGVGAGTLLLNSTDSNTAIGAGALLNNLNGPFNTANGAFALFQNTIGNTNTAVGSSALLSNTIGSGNTADGEEALVNNISGNLNLALGIHAGAGVITANNVICIGAGVPGVDVNDTTWIGNVYGVTTQSGTTATVIVSDSGQLGTVASSERFKKDIAAMGKASEAILSLRPVTFHYKSDAKRAPQFGLIAEEVAKVNPALVLPDKEGKPYTVRYDQVNAMLLNEFLKEHKKVEEQQATIGQLKSNAAKQEATISELDKNVEVLTTQLKEQAAQIQKVSAQIESSQPAPHLVVSGR
jgi:Chaperone of endosialidase